MGTHNVIVQAAFDMQKFKDPESQNFSVENYDFPYLNAANTNLSFSISSSPSTLDWKGFYRDSYSGTLAEQNDVIDFSSNGVTGLFQTITSFDLQETNFTRQNIFFTAKLLSLSGTPRKNIPKIEQIEDFLVTHTTNDTIILHNTIDDKIIVDDSNLFFELVRRDGSIVPAASAIFYSNFGSNSANNAGGYHKGYLNTEIADTGLRIKMTYTTDFGVISAFSSPFNVYNPSSTYDIRKTGEDTDAEENYKKLTYQPALQNQPLLMEEFLGQIVGNKNSQPETLGIKTYEKIKNFVGNISDPSVANIKSLTSLIEELNITYDQYNQTFPPSLTRLLDILSVSLSRQKGQKNTFQLNFDDKGFANKDTYGKNKGTKLDIKTTILNTGENSRNILAYEKFSEKYSLVNTNILSATDVSYLSSNAYALSSYNNTWGWGLVLPDNVTGENLDRYYQFYNFNDTIEGSYLQKFIDFDNTNNTYLSAISSIDDYERRGGLADQVIMHNLYTNLGLISGYSLNGLNHGILESTTGTFYDPTYTEGSSTATSTNIPIDSSTAVSPGTDSGGGYSAPSSPSY